MPDLHWPENTCACDRPIPADTAMCSRCALDFDLGDDELEAFVRKGWA